MQTYIAFNVCGQSGFVQQEALRTFKRKNEAVETVLRIQSVIVGRSLDQFFKNDLTQSEREALDKAMRTIISANRTIKSKGWFFLSKQAVDHLVSTGCAIIKGA